MEMFSPTETDAQCWHKMLALQREYHCYNSARLEAAVEALESGRDEEELVREFYQEGRRMMDGC